MDEPKHVWCCWTPNGHGPSFHLSDPADITPTGWTIVRFSAEAAPSVAVAEAREKLRMLLRSDRFTATDMGAVFYAESLVDALCAAVRAESGEAETRDVIFGLRAWLTAAIDGRRCPECSSTADHQEDCDVGLSLAAADAWLSARGAR